MKGLFDIDKVLNESVEDTLEVDVITNRIHSLLESGEINEATANKLLGYTESDDDILNMSVFDEDGTAPNVPSGVKETPTAKPWDLNDIGIPGGDKETPTAKPYDASAVSIPASKEITVDTYNDALGLLKKSYKESIDILDILTVNRPK